MTLDTVPFAKLGPKNLYNLLDARVREGKTIEYKSNPPHMVTTGEDTRFYSRGPAGDFPRAFGSENPAVAHAAADQHS